MAIPPEVMIRSGRPLPLPLRELWNRPDFLPPLFRDQRSFRSASRIRTIPFSICAIEVA